MDLDRFSTLMGTDMREFGGMAKGGRQESMNTQTETFMKESGVMT